MADPSDDLLREMAEHRGLKLVKSRRRKPGVGDFGKFGLTDAAGKALLGIDDDGLTASAADIQEYLRMSEQSTWKQSAETTPDMPPASKKPRAPEPEDEDVSIRRHSKRTTPAPLPPQRGAGDGTAAASREPETKTRPKPALRLVPKAKPAPAPVPEPPPPAPEPILRVRAAAPSDAAPLVALLRQLGGVALTQAEIVDNLARARKAKAGMVVAELDEIVGCCGWAVVPTVHRGAVGRLTALVVDKDHRRRGLGTELLAAAEKALAKAGCSQVEAMSDITINNSHNFFRSLKFEQTSYHFVRGIED